MHCAVFYYHNWPVGHGEQFPIAFTINGTAEFANQSALWLAHPLINMVKSQLSSSMKINRNVQRNINKGLLINCLDPCFGHIIWKLFTAARYKTLDPESGLVVLIPKQCSWMVPQHVAEIWEVEVPLSKLHVKLDGLHDFISQCPLNSLELVPQPTHPDHQNLPLKDFFKTEGFSLDSFTSRKPQITFIWREDRFWLRTKLEQWMWSFATKYNLNWFKPWFLLRQRHAIKKVVDLVKRTLPDAQFAVAGLGKAGNMKGVQDLRYLEMNTERELEWCALYAKSHFVVGIHGSSMLIPTALSAGFIELLPPYKIPFMTEDILMRHDSRFQLFLGRHLNLFCGPAMVAQHIVDAFQSFAYLKSNTEA